MQMTRRSAKRRVVTGDLVFVVAWLLVVAPRPTAQSTGPGDLAARLTGSWKLNAELTPTSPKPGRGRGIASRSAGRFAVLVAAPQQRGGRGSGGGGNEASAPLPAS